MGKPLHYKGCTLHRIIPQFMCQVLPCSLFHRILGRRFHSRKRSWRRVDLRRTLCRRELHAEAHRSWITLHGELWSEYERIAVLYHDGTVPVAGWTPRGVWRGEEGNECAEGFGDVWNGERHADVWQIWREWACRKTVAITDCGELKEKIWIVCFIRFWWVTGYQQTRQWVEGSGCRITSYRGSACIGKIEFSIFISRFPR